MQGRIDGKGGNECNVIELADGMGTMIKDDTGMDKRGKQEKVH
jgi:hypothetical protein